MEKSYFGEECKNMMLILQDNFDLDPKFKYFYNLLKKLKKNRSVSCEWIEESLSSAKGWCSECSNIRFPDLSMLKLKRFSLSNIEDIGYLLDMYEKTYGKGMKKEKIKSKLPHDIPSYYIRKYRRALKNLNKKLFHKKKIESKKFNIDI